MKLGPRRVLIRNPALGTENEIQISMVWVYTHGEPWEDDPSNLTGQVSLVGAGWNIELKAYAVDDIQVVGRLMSLAGAALLGSCERDGLELRTPDHPWPITDAMQLF